MRVKQNWRQTCALLLAALQLLTPAFAYAQQATSTHYQVNEVQFGSGGNVNTSSSSYNAQSSLGSLGGGRSSSANFTADAGFLTQNEPFLEMGVINGTIDLGDLSRTTTGSGAGSFYVRAYTASGYSIVALGDTLVDDKGNHIVGKGTLGTPIVGTEELGINLVKNTDFCGVGCDLGDDPAPQPNSGFASGTAASGYGTAGQFKYVRGDTIATAPNGNGQTNFTVSFVANVSAVTPAGNYRMVTDFAAIASY